MKKILSKFKFYTLAIMLGVALAAGATFAWNATWHGTDWISSGKTIKAQETAENFEYLKQRADIIDSIPTCTDSGKALQYNGTAFICASISSGSGSGNSNCSAQTVTAPYDITYHYCAADMPNSYTRTRTGHYDCPDSINGQSIECTLKEEYGRFSGSFQCVNGSFELLNKAHAETGRTFCGSCFTQKTLITMADGSKKEIIKIKAGDKVLGKGRVINNVKGIERVPLAGRKLYSINDGPAFVTAEHPFLTKDGWKAISPEALLKEYPSLAKTLHPKTLEVGDVLITENGTVKILNISAHSAKEQTVYNLILDGNNTYYANKYLVHNKM